MKTSIKTLFIAAAIALTACQQHETPVPKPVATLARPVMTVGKKVGEREKLLIPETALVSRAGIPGVFVLSNREARFRMVKVGRTRGTQVEILSGLAGTETLVLGDLGMVHDGTPIIPN